MVAVFTETKTISVHCSLSGKKLKKGTRCQTSFSFRKSHKRSRIYGWRFFDVEIAATKLHKKMKTILKANELQVYELLYIENLEEDEVAKKMGYKTSEKNRQPSYKQIKNIKKSILTKVKKEIEKKWRRYFLVCPN